MIKNIEFVREVSGDGVGPKIFNTRPARESNYLTLLVKKVGRVLLTNKVKVDEKREFLFFSTTLLTKL